MKRYPMEKQAEAKDCGASCLLMIIRYYQGYVPKEDLFEMTKTNKNGTTAYHLTETLKDIGFDAYGIKCSFKDFELSNIILPCIANVIIDNSYTHFIVIYEINYKKKYLIIGDPADKLKKITFDEFNKIYNEVLIFAKPNRTIPVINNNDYSFIWSILKRHHKLLKKLIYLSVFLTILSIVSSLFLETMFKGINFKSEYYLIMIFVIFFSINMIKILIDLFRNRLLIYINHRIDMELTFSVFKKVVMLPYHYYRNRTTGDILSRMNDLFLVRNTVSRALLSLVIDLPLAFISLIILFIINHLLFLMAVFIFTLYIIIIIIFKRTSERHINKVQNSKASYTSFMVEAINGFETVKGIHIENNVDYKFRIKYFDFLNRILKYQKNYILKNTMQTLINDIGFIVIVLIGSLLVINKSLTFGNLLTFTVLLSYFLEPIRNVANLDNDIKESKNALKRIGQLLQKKTIDGMINKKIEGKITFKSLTYSFNDRDIVLKNINLNINPGDKVMLIGRSGSGKSTLMKLIMKYYPVSSGTVFLDNVDINNIQNESVNRGIIYINQSEVLFNDTVYNNINITNNNDEQFLKVTKICYVDQIKYYNLGYNLVIEENGFNLSGGEKQRIVLARALMQPFNILIIDEGLSQVDIDLERKILKNIFSCFSSKTIIFISHRLDNLDLFNHLIEMENGAIIRNVKKQEFNDL